MKDFTFFHQLVPRNYSKISNTKTTERSISLSSPSFLLLSYHTHIHLKFVTAKQCTVSTFLHTLVSHTFPPLLQLDRCIGFELMGSMCYKNTGSCLKWSNFDLDTHKTSRCASMFIFASVRPLGLKRSARGSIIFANTLSSTSRFLQFGCSV